MVEREGRVEGYAGRRSPRRRRRRRRSARPRARRRRSGCGANSEARHPRWGRGRNARPRSSWTRPATSSSRRVTTGSASTTSPTPPACRVPPSTRTSRRSATCCSRSASRRSRQRISALDEIDALEDGWTHDSAYELVRIYLRMLEDHGAFILVWSQATYGDEELAVAGVRARLATGRRLGRLFQRRPWCVRPTPTTTRPASGSRCW